MKPLPKVPHRLVLVEWQDSAQPVSAWQWVDDYQAPETISCISVGYLIADADTAVAIAPNLGHVEQGRLQASGIIRIPRCSIKRIVNLRAAA